MLILCHFSFSNKIELSKFCRKNKKTGQKHCPAFRLPADESRRFLCKIGDFLHDLCNFDHLFRRQPIHSNLDAVKSVFFLHFRIRINVQQFRDRHFQPVGNLRNGFNRGAFFPAFHLADISGVNFWCKSQFFLTKVLPGAELTDSSPTAAATLVLFFIMEILCFCSKVFYISILKGIRNRFKYL